MLGVNSCRHVGGLKMEVKVVEDVGGDEIGPEKIMHWYDPEVRVAGVVVVDTTVRGKSVGGTRMLPDITTKEIASLAREMSYKYVMLGRPRGGGKAGIWADPEQISSSQREKIMRAYGRAIKPLAREGIYFPGADMGTSHTDLVCVREESGQQTPLPKFWLQEKDGESLDYHFTGYGVIMAAQAACEFLNMDISRATLAIEGFGKVGTGAARYAIQLGAKVVAISTNRGAIYQEKGLDVGQLIELRKKFGDDVVNRYKGGGVIKKEELFFLPVDILVPGSRPWVIHEKNVGQIKAKLISSGANIPMTDEAEEKLYERGITVIPNFISNSGGALSSHLGSLDVTIDQSFVCIKKILSENVLNVLQAASQQKVSPTRLATQIAKEKVRQWRTQGPPPEEEYLAKIRHAAVAS
jgi:glutamate dehydrogenase (NAD(P)+)